MPVYKLDKLPPHHPFAQGLIVFGVKRPTASAPPLPVVAERIENAPWERLAPASSTQQPPMPTRDQFDTEDGYEEAQGFWRNRRPGMPRPPSQG